MPNAKFYVYFLHNRSEREDLCANKKEAGDESDCASAEPHYEHLAKAKPKRLVRLMSDRFSKYYFERGCTFI